MASTAARTRSISPSARARPTAQRNQSDALPPRATSRSERLLRDTLRRADEQDRHGRRLSSQDRPLRRTRDDEDEDEDDEDASWMHRVRSRGNSVSAGATRPSSPRLARGHTTFDLTAPVTPTRRASLQRSPASAPTVPRSPTSAQRRPRTPPKSPHELALRSRLEGALRKHESHPSLDGMGSVRHLSRAPTNSRSNSGDSVSEWPWSVPETPVDSPRMRSVEPLTPPPTPPHALGRLHYPSSSASSSQHSSASSSTDLADKRFNVRRASDICKRMDGYVSFGDVEGLGLPPTLDEEQDEGDDLNGRKRWRSVLGWFGKRGERQEAS